MEIFIRVRAEGEVEKEMIGERWADFAEKYPVKKSSVYLGSLFGLTDLVDESVVNVYIVELEDESKISEACEYLQKIAEPFTDERWVIRSRES